VQTWNTTAAVRYPRLARGLDVDVAIVGAGITGLTLALQLVRARRSGAVLDQQTEDPYWPSRPAPAPVARTASARQVRR